MASCVTPSITSLLSLPLPLIQIYAGHTQSAINTQLPYQLKATRLSELTHQCLTRHALATWLAVSGDVPVIHTALFMQKIHISSASLPPLFSFRCMSPHSRLTTQRSSNCKTARIYELRLSSKLPPH